MAIRGRSIHALQPLAALITEPPVDRLVAVGDLRIERLNLLMEPGEQDVPRG